MLRIEEIVGCMDDEFRYALDQLDGATLAGLRNDQAALRRMRPVGISHREAVAMIDAILEARAKAAQRPPKAPPRRRPTAPGARKRAEAAPAPAPDQPRAETPVAEVPMPPPPLLLAGPAPVPPVRLPPPPGPVALLPPPAIRLTGCPTAAPPPAPVRPLGWLGRLRAALLRLVNRLR
ncbi:MAG: hypothetical protein ACM33T_13580 [Solirubrobacterales bacterium]